MGPRSDASHGGSECWSSSCCSKQSLRAIFSDQFTSDNHFKKRNKKSLFRFTNPRSTKSIRCQTASTRASPQTRVSCAGNQTWEGMSRRATYGVFPSPLHRSTGDLLDESVKEVIQPQVPLRLPCYDFAPVTALAFGRLVLCRF